MTRYVDQTPGGEKERKRERQRLFRIISEEAKRILEFHAITPNNII